ncbi:MAG: TadE/TadG family type IV pilus assembly protein [Aeromicrobium erythreum]
MTLHRRAPVRRRERGAAAVEFALVLPLVITCITAVVEGGSRYTNQTQASHYAAVAARDLAIDPAKSATTVVGSLKTADGNTRSYTVSVPSTCSATSDTVKVVVAATIPSPTGMFGSYGVSGTGVARCEN